MSSSATRSVKVTEVNPLLLCVLCGGYYVDATTIIECLHSFCKSCIVRYLETNKYCPICDVQVHKSKPLLNIRADRRLQAIVYKLVPGLFQRELNNRKEFYKRYAELQSSSGGHVSEPPDESPIFYPDDSILIGVQYTTTPPTNFHSKRYLRCPAAITIHHLHKLMKAKFSLNDYQKVEFLHNGDTLENNMSLMDLAYMYNWKRKLPVEMEYRLLECLPKKPKRSFEGRNTECDNKKQNNDVCRKEVCLMPDKSSDQPDREVQLQISENGVISVQSIDTNPVNNDVSMKVDENIPEAKTPVDKVQPETMKLIKSLEKSVTMNFDGQVPKDKGNDNVYGIHPTKTSTNNVKETDSKNNNLYVNSRENTKLEQKNKLSTSIESVDRFSALGSPQISFPDTSVTIQRVYPGATRDSNHSRFAKETPNKLDFTMNPKPSTEKSIITKQPNHIRYKTLKSPIKQWNPSIPRSSLMAMKQAQAASSSKDELEGGTPTKAPKFFKMRNVPRFLGNPASGVKPMYQIATSSEVTTTTSQPSTSQSSKPSSEITVMKIDPKTLTPIPVVCTSKSPMPSPAIKLQPAVSINPKKSSDNHLTDSRNFSRNTSKNSVSPLKTSGKHHTPNLPSNPFLLPSPHMMYGGFPRPFSPVDSSSSRMPTESQLFQAMSMICSPNAAFHPSLPPSISMLFNPHTHNRPSQNDKMKYTQNDFMKSVPMVTPSVQRVPPTCLSAKVPSSSASQSSSFSKDSTSLMSSNQTNIEKSPLIKSISEKVVNHVRKEAPKEVPQTPSTNSLGPGAPLRNCEDQVELRLVDKQQVPLSNGLPEVSHGTSGSGQCSEPQVSKEEASSKVPHQSDSVEKTNVAESRAGESDNSSLR